MNRETLTISINIRRSEVHTHVCRSRVQQVMVLLRVTIGDGGWTLGQRGAALWHGADDTLMSFVECCGLAATVDNVGAVCGAHGRDKKCVLKCGRETC
jgi:hypothetical protein